VKFPTPRSLLPGRTALLAILAGALNTLAFAPFGAWPLAVLSPLALYLLLRDTTARTAFSRGFAYGFGFWLSGVCWVYVSIHVYGYTPVATAVVLTLLFAAMLSLLFFAWWTALYAHLARGVLRPLLFVALWVLAEWVRSWLFTGFPWLYQGYAFIDTPLKHYAPIGGVLLVSALAVGAAVLLVDLLRGTQRARLVAGAALVAIAAGGVGLSHIAWTKTSGAPKTVSLLQGNIPQDMKWLTQMQQPTIDIYTELSKNEWGRDIVIWPESAIPLFVHEAIPLVDALRARADASGSAFITGMPYMYFQNERPVFHNSVLSLGGIQQTAMYHKVHLVPFGEVVPFSSLLRAIAPFFALEGIPLEGFARGQENQPPLPAGKLGLATFLCYEIVYPDYVRRQAASADVLLTVSNDGWFGDSHGPHQHFEISRMRAVENGRWLLRGTNTGITGIIDPQGNVVAKLPQFERTVLRGNVTPMKGATPFMVWGNWLVLLAGFVIITLAVWRRRR
jgi:apolipoprotein N-acyltransferase